MSPLRGNDNRPEYSTDLKKFFLVHYHRDEHHQMPQKWLRRTNNKICRIKSSACLAMGTKNVGSSDVMIPDLSQIFNLLTIPDPDFDAVNCEIVAPIWSGICQPFLRFWIQIRIQ